MWKILLKSFFPQRRGQRQQFFAFFIIVELTFTKTQGDKNLLRCFGLSVFSSKIGASCCSSHKAKSSLFCYFTLTTILQLNPKQFLKTLKLPNSNVFSLVNLSSFYSPSDLSIKFLETCISHAKNVIFHVIH